VVDVLRVQALTCPWQALAAEINESLLNGYWKTSPTGRSKGLIGKPWTIPPNCGSMLRRAAKRNHFGTIPDFESSRNEAGWPTLCELLELRWRDFQLWGMPAGTARDRLPGKAPQLGQTRKALRPVYIPKELVDDLWLSRQESKHFRVRPDFIFPNRLIRGGFIDPKNCRKRCGR
jgi:integrase